MIEDENGAKIFRDNLNALVGAKGITQKELATAVDVSASTVSHWLAGKKSKMPRMGVIDKLCNYFGVDRSAFFTPQSISGDSTVLSNEEKLLIKNYRALDEKTRRVLDTVASALTTQQQAAAIFGNIIQATSGNAALNVNGTVNQSINL